METSFRSFINKVAKVAERKINVETKETNKEKQNVQKLVTLLRECPIPNEQVLSNLGLFLTSKELARILFVDFIYRQAIEVQGIIVEFGTRWGNNLAIFEALRGIYEPFNKLKQIIGFDTFEGFPHVSSEDGNSNPLVSVGNLSCTVNYPDYLDRIMKCHEESNPLSYIKKYKIRVGDVTKEIDRYLKDNPETIIALAFFDLDLYRPTKKCLEAIRSHLVRGSILAFDELNDHNWPGETIALKEVFGLNNIRLKRHPQASRVSYFAVE